jgi:hypothetical protein
MTVSKVSIWEPSEDGEPSRRSHASGRSSMTWTASHATTTANHQVAPRRSHTTTTTVNHQIASPTEPRNDDNREAGDVDDNRETGDDAQEVFNVLLKLIGRCI